MSVTEKSVPPPLTAPSEETVRLELEVVLNSAAFRKSERQSKFLRFICERALAGEGTKLNEYLIAHHVFERGAEYSPGEDSVVRRQAYSLRQKLQEYYLHEGRDRLLRIELPVGRYVPVFSFSDDASFRNGGGTVVRNQLQPPLSGIADLPPVRNSSSRRSRWLFAGVMALCLIVGVSAGWLAGVRSAYRTVVDAGFRDIWGAWLSDPAQLAICFSTPITASIRQVPKRYLPHSIIDRISISLSENQAEQLRRQLDLPSGGVFYLFPGLGHAKMGEALGSIKLSSLFTRVGISVRVTESRFLNWDDFRRENIILLGHDEANSFVDPLLQRLPLRMARTTGEKPRRIINPQPRPGERSEYYPEYPPGTIQPQEDYALISMLGGVDGQHRLALVNGVNTEGTQMGLEYLTDPASLRYLSARLNQVAPPSPTRHFQIVLHCELRDRLPTKPELVAVRIVP